MQFFGARCNLAKSLLYALNGGVDEKKGKVVVGGIEKIEDEVNEVYVVISADYDFDGYNLGEWNNIQYNGFYTTANDAENEIYGYLNKQE